MPQDYLIIDMLQGLGYVVILCLIGITLKLALTEPLPREGTEKARRIVFSEHGPEQEAEEMIERLLV